MGGLSQVCNDDVRNDDVSNDDVVVRVGSY